jgi:hypothetical protein
LGVWWGGFFVLWADYKSVYKNNKVILNRIREHNVFLGRTS